MSASHITPGNVRAFEMVTNHGEHCSMLSCLVNGEPGVAIVLLMPDEEVLAVLPLFVSITPGMELTFPGKGTRSGGGGGPQRRFAAAKEAIKPSPRPS